MSKKENNWTDADIELLRDKYSSWSAISIALRLRKSVNAIVCKANELGLKKERPLPWSDEENETLKHWYPIEGPQGIMHRFPDRTNFAVRGAARRNGIKFSKTRHSSKPVIETISTSPEEWDEIKRLAVCGKWVAT